MRLATYRPFRFAVAVALLLAMATPLVTYACDLTGIVETAMPMAMADMSEDTAMPHPDSDCPCDGQMEEVCGSKAADCVAVINCHGDSFESDACCSSQPELTDGIISAPTEPIHVQPAVSVLLSDPPALHPDRPRIGAPGHERAPPHPSKAPVHILHSSLLL